MCVWWSIFNYFILQNDKPVVHELFATSGKESSFNDGDNIGKATYCNQDIQNQSIKNILSGEESANSMFQS